MITEKKLLNASSLARRLRVNVRWLKAEAEAGRLPHVRAENVFLFNFDAVESTLLENANGVCRRRLLTDGEAARLLRMIRMRLNRLAKAGKIPCVMLPDGDMRYDEADLWRWIDSRKHGVPAVPPEPAKLIDDIRSLGSGAVRVRLDKLYSEQKALRALLRGCLLSERGIARNKTPEDIS
jgi:hypothetical protein